MEIVAADIDRIHFRIRDLDGFGIFILVEAAPHLKPGRRGRRSDELADDLVADQRLATPVLGDEGKEPMFDAIPFTGAGWVMDDSNGKPGLVDEGLQLAFPQANTKAIAAPTIGGDEQAGCVRIPALTQGEPPASNAFDQAAVS